MAPPLKRRKADASGTSVSLKVSPRKGVHRNRGKPGSRLERHGFHPRGWEREGASRRAQRPLCGRKKPDAQAPGTWETSGTFRRRKDPVKAWVEGNPWELVPGRREAEPQQCGAAHDGQVELRDGTNPRGRGKRWLRSPRTNDAEEGLLATGEPLSRRRASKGRTPRRRVGRRRQSAVGSKPGEPHDR